MNKNLIKRIENWQEHLKDTQPDNVIMEGDTFEESAYFLFNEVLKELKTN